MIRIAPVRARRKINKEDRPANNFNFLVGAEVTHTKCSEWGEGVICKIERQSSLGPLKNLATVRFANEKDEKLFEIPNALTNRFLTLKLPELMKRTKVVVQEIEQQMLREEQEREREKYMKKQEREREKLRQQQECEREKLRQQQERERQAIEREAERERLAEEARQRAREELLNKLHSFGFRGPVHMTSMENFLSIMKQGELKSREQLRVEEHDFVDAALPEALAKTLRGIQSYVRFYYAFHTPTYYHNRYDTPVAMVWSEDLLFECTTSMCPISPVYCFQRGSWDHAADFCWDLIFGRGYYPPEVAGNYLIPHYRNAEILSSVPVSTLYLKEIIFQNTEDLEAAKAALGGFPDDITVKVDAGTFG